MRRSCNRLEKPGDFCTIIVADRAEIEPDDEILIDRSGVTLKAKNENATIKGEGDLIRIEADDVTIDGFSILEDPNDASRAAIVPGGVDITIKNNDFEGFNNHIAWDRADLPPTGDTVIKNNEFRDVGLGNAEEGSAVAQTEGVSGIDILENEFYNNRNDIGLADDATDVTIEGNEFLAEDSERYISNRNKEDPPSQEILDENTFDPDAVIANLEADDREDIVPEPANNEVLNINNRDRCEEDDAIQDAIYGADTDHTILVGPGEYDEDVVMDVENLVLEGPNAGTPGYEDRGEEATINSIEIGDKSGSGAPANYAEFRGFEISTDADLGEGTGTAIGSNSHEIVVEDNVVKNFTTGFTSALASSDYDEIKFTLENNLFKNRVSAVSTEGGYEAIIENNKFHNNRNGIGFNADDTFEWSIVDNDFLIDDVGELESKFDDAARYVSNRGELEGESAEDVIDDNTFEPNARFAEEGDNTTHIVPEGSGEIE